mmetsp:Transcript_8644/g.9910  ORF Transcript_8644/g.9910 Transcript_8644/m.9910 type:complete len:263 (+) Transcript_8644:81-869(+)
MKLSFAPATFFLLLSLSAHVAVADDKDKSIEDSIGDVGDAVADWWDTMKGTVENITAAVVTTAACGDDFSTLQTNNPDLKTAYDAYVATYSWKDTQEQTGGQKIQTSTITYGADEMAAYKAACVAIENGAVFFPDFPSGITVACAAADESESFDMVYNNYGDCWPITDSCEAFGSGWQAWMTELEKEIAQDDSYTCKMTNTPSEAGAESEMSKSDGGDKKDSDGGSMAPSDAPMDDEPSSASKMASSLAVVVAATVGTVMFL